MNDIFYNVIVKLMLEDDVEGLTNTNRRVLRLVNRRTKQEVDEKFVIPTLYSHSDYAPSVNIVDSMLLRILSYNPTIWRMTSFDNEFALYLANCIGCFRTTHFIHPYHHDFDGYWRSDLLCIHNENDGGIVFETDDVVICYNVTNTNIMNYVFKHTGHVIVIMDRKSLFE